MHFLTNVFMGMHYIFIFKDKDKIHRVLSGELFESVPTLYEELVNGYKGVGMEIIGGCSCIDNVEIVNAKHFVEEIAKRLDTGESLDLEKELKYYNFKKPENDYLLS